MTENQISIKEYEERFSQALKIVNNQNKILLNYLNNSKSNIKVEKYEKQLQFLRDYGITDLENFLG